MPSMSSSSAPGMAAAVARPPETCTILSPVPCTTRAGTCTACSRWRPVRLGGHRHHLAQHAAGRPAAVERLVGLGQRLRGLRGIERGADQRPDGRAALGVRRPAAATSPDQRGQQAGVLPADGALAGRRHDAGQRAHPLRVLDRHRLHDHAAHRDPDQVRRPRDRGGRAGDGVAGQVAQTVRRPHPAAGVRADQHRPRDPAGHLGRPAGVAVVVADRRRSRARRASGTARGPTTSSARPGPSRAAAGRRRGSRRSGSRARRPARPARTARWRRRPGRWHPSRRLSKHSTYQTVTSG